MPDVWLEYGREPNAELDLLLEPFAGSTTAELAKAVLDADHTPTRPQPIELAYNQSHVAVKLTFEEMLRSVLPLSNWWQERLWPAGTTSVADVLKQRKRDIIAGLKEPMREQGRRADVHRRAARHADLVRRARRPDRLGAAAPRRRPARGRAPAGPDREPARGAGRQDARRPAARAAARTSASCGRSTATGPRAPRCGARATRSRPMPRRCCSTCTAPACAGRSSTPASTPPTRRSPRATRRRARRRVLAGARDVRLHPAAQDPRRHGQPIPTRSATPATASARRSRPACAAAGRSTGRCSSTS